MNKKNSIPTQPVYRCEWRDVVALNFDVDPRILQSSLPQGTRIVSYNDHTLITLMVKNIREFRPWKRKLVLFRSIDEIDLRTYISWEQDGHIRQGHFKLANLVSSKTASRVLRFLTGQQSEVAQIKRETKNLQNVRRDALPTAEFRWKFKDEENHFRVSARSTATKSKPDSKEQFVLRQEHRFIQRNNGVFCQPIRQAPWPVWNASSGSFHVNLSHFVDKELRKYLKKPKFVLLSQGGEVTVSKGIKVS